MKQDNNARISKASLQKWLDAISSNRLLAEMNRAPKAAQAFFGQGPAQRGDLEELVLIANARSILLKSDRELAQTITGFDFVVNWLARSGVYAHECARHGHGMISITLPGVLFPPPPRYGAGKALLEFLKSEADYGAESCRTADTLKLIRRCAQSVVRKAFRA